MVDPTVRWNDSAIISQYEGVIATGTALKANVYMAQAANPFLDTTKMDRRVEAFQQVAALLQKSAVRGLRYKHEYFRREDHYSIPTPAFYYGMLFLFDGYKFPLNMLGGASGNAVAMHYESFSKRCGASILPPGKLLDQAGLYLLQEKRIDAALEILKLNETYYPASAVPYYSLGVAYRAKGDTAEAIRYFKMALQRNANHEGAKAGMAALAKK